jgi:hypothetical protein
MYREDKCQTLVRIDPDSMEKLGVKSGDIVKVTGKDSCAAFCFPLDEEEQEKLKLQDIKVEYINQPEKKLDYPRIVLSSLVDRNVRPSRPLRFVKVEKFPTQNSQNNIPQATLVTLGTMEFPEKVMPNYKQNLDYSEFYGTLLSKNFKINIPFFPEYTQLQQNKFSDKKLPPVPSSFSTVIVDAQPQDQEFWLVTENTKFEFQNVSMNQLRGVIPQFEGIKLQRVIPIVKKISIENSQIMIATLEVYENSMKLKSYIQYREKIPEKAFEDPSNLNEITRRMNPDNPELVVEITDDLGNVYSDGFTLGGGGSSGPDPVTGEMVSERNQDFGFESVLDSGAKEITVTIKEIQFIHRPSRMPKPTRPPQMTPIDVSDAKISILEGPWEFKVKLD